MSIKERFNLVASALLILFLGLSTGYSIGYFHSAQAAFPQISTARERNPGISTVKFLTLENGKLKGEIGGQKTRIAYSPEKIQDFQVGETFEIPIYNITLGQFYSVRDLPDGMQFIASKQGKYYYSVLDPKAFKITPKNRIYFIHEDEAEKLGYLPSK